MRIKINNARRTLSWATLLLAIGLSLPAAAQTNYPLRIRGSSQLETNYTNGSLVIVFQPSAGPAGNGLQPGQGSWLDRGFRPTEPHVLQQTIPEDQAKAMADYLNGPDHYATFYCVNGDQGFFVANDSQPFLVGPRPNGLSGPLVWASVLHGNSGSPGGGAVVISGNRNGTGLTKVPEGKDHHEEGKDRHVADKDKHGREKDGHDKDHHGGSRNNGVALVKPLAKPLVKQKSAAPKTAPHPTPKKKK